MNFIIFFFLFSFISCSELSYINIQNQALLQHRAMNLDEDLTPSPTSFLTNLTNSKNSGQKVCTSCAR